MKTKQIYMYALGALISIGFFALMIILMYKGVPEQNRDIMNITIGALIGAFGTIVNYFFGSSLGSKNKTDIISKQN